MFFFFYSSGVEQHKRAHINDAVGIVEEPIVYTKLADAVNKKLKRDWDNVEARPEQAEQICILLHITSAQRPALHKTKPINLFVQSCNEGMF